MSENEPIQVDVGPDDSNSANTVPQSGTPIKKKMSRINKLKMDAGAKSIPKYPWDNDDEFDTITKAETPGAFKEASSQRLEAFESIQDFNAANPYEDQIKNPYPWGEEFKNEDSRPAKEIYKEQERKKKSTPKSVTSEESIIKSQTQGAYKFGLVEPSGPCCLSLIVASFCPWCAMDHITHAVRANIRDEPSGVDSMLENLSYYCCYLFPCAWSCTGMRLFQIDQHIESDFNSRCCISTFCLPCEINREYRQLVKLGRIHPDIIKLRSNCFFWDFDGWRFKSDVCSS